MTPEHQEDEVPAPVSDVFELLIVEPESNQRDSFIASVPVTAVGARLRAAINRITDTIHMGGHMVYDGSIIQDNVALGQGYGIQDQCQINLVPREGIAGNATAPNSQEFHSCPGSSSDIRRLEDAQNRVQVIVDTGAAQSLFRDGDGIYRYADGTTPSGFEADPSGQLTLPTPLVAGGPAESSPVAMLQPLPVKTPNPATPVKTADGKGEKEDPLTPVVLARTNVYQVPPRAVKTTQKLLPTAKVAAKAAAKAEQPVDQNPPTCCRDGCENPSWNGKAVFY